MVEAWWKLLCWTFSSSDFSAYKTNHHSFPFSVFIPSCTHSHLTIPSFTPSILNTFSSFILLSVSIHTPFSITLLAIASYALLVSLASCFHLGFQICNKKSLFSESTGKKFVFYSTLCFGVLHSFQQWFFYLGGIVGMNFLCRGLCSKLKPSIQFSALSQK